MSTITKTIKVDYKRKDVKFQDGILVDENGEVINLISDLSSIYGNREFTLTATITSKSEYDIEDFASE